MRKIAFIVSVTAVAWLMVANVQSDDQTAADIECVTIVNCPRGISTSHCTPMSFQFEAVNARSERPSRGIRYHLVSGPGAIDKRTGLWSFDPKTVGITEWGQTFRAMVVATQGRGKHADTCRFNVRVYNYAPRPFLPGPYHKDSIPVAVGVDNVIPIWWLDRDSCDTVQKQVTALPPQSSGAMYLNDAGNLIFHPSLSDTGMSFVVRLTADDGINATSLDLRLVVEAPVVRPSEYTLRIERVSSVLQGQYQDVSVKLERASTDSVTGGLGGFDLLMCYDASALSLQLVKTDSSPFYYECNWEYFTYRYGAIGYTHPGIPSGFVRVVGLAETNNGPIHPTCTPKYIPALPATLFTMRFLVSNDRTLECQYLPIRFLWEDCGDNALANWDGSQLYIANRVFEHHEQDLEIDPSLASFPGLAGVPADSCIQAEPNRPSSERSIDFYHGGMDIVCADSIVFPCWYSEVQLPEITDEEMFCSSYAQYFLYGLSAFGSYPIDQPGCTDLNNDSAGLTVADLVMMQRIVLGDGLPAPVASSNEAHIYNVIGAPSTISFRTPDTLGAIALIFEGEGVPTPLTQEAAVHYVYRNDTTRILIASACGHPISRLTEGSLFQVAWNDTLSHRLLHAEAATYLGGVAPCIAVEPTSVEHFDQISLPRAFALRQNYPNPFNAGTVISFDLPKASDVRLEVLNVAGQLVHEVSRHYAAGSHRIEWDGMAGRHSLASGVYYYRVTAGEFTATKKMMFLK